MTYIEFMKNFLLADSSGVLAVRLILSSLAQKRLFPTFYTSCASSWWKIFFSPIRASLWLLDSFWHPEPKNVWFQLSTHHVRRVHEKFSSSWWLLDSFWYPEPKKKWFLLCRHDVRRVHEKFSSHRFDRVLVVRLILTSWAQKRLIPTFYTSCTSSSWKISFSPIRASWWLLDSFLHPVPKNKWFLLCINDVPQVHEKFSSRRFERADGC